MSDGMKVNTEGVGGKQGGGRRNNFCNNIQSNKAVKFHTSKIKGLNTATYIVSQFYIAGRYEKVTEEIITYVMKNLPGGVHLARGTRDGKLDNMLLDTKPNKRRRRIGHQ